jgi:hypothetical protein
VEGKPPARGSPQTVLFRTDAAATPILLHYSSKGNARMVKGGAGEDKAGALEKMIKKLLEEPE